MKKGKRKKWIVIRGTMRGYFDYDEEVEKFRSLKSVKKWFIKDFISYYPD